MATPAGIEPSTAVADKRQGWQEQSPIGREMVERFKRAATARRQRDSRLEEIAKYLAPDDRGMFYAATSWSSSFEPEDWETFIYDSGPQEARDLFVGILDSLVTPPGKIWHRLVCPIEELREDGEVQEFLQGTNNDLWQARYGPDADFVGEQQRYYYSLGNYGIGTTYVDGRIGSQSLCYQNIHAAHSFPELDAQGAVCRFTRWFQLSARQAAGLWGEKMLPAKVREALAKPHTADSMFSFIQCVTQKPRGTWDPERQDADGMEFASYYVCLEGESTLTLKGYHTMPFIVGWYRRGKNATGYGPADTALGSIRTLQEQARTDLINGQRIVDPALFIPDDGAFSVNIEPGALNYGGVTKDGRFTVHALPAGDPRISEEKMERQLRIIKKLFLNDAVTLLTDDRPQMTAYQVEEIKRQKASVLVSAVGRQQIYAGRLIDRELDVMSQLGRVRPMPPQLREAGGIYALEFDSPITDLMRAEAGAGFVRTMQIQLDWMAKSGDTSVRHVVNSKRAFRGLYRGNATPETWLNSDEEVAELEAADAEQVERQQEAAELPAVTGLLGAAAKVDEVTEPE